jgi:hypothetical protein
LSGYGTKSSLASSHTSRDAAALGTLGAGSLALCITEWKTHAADASLVAISYDTPSPGTFSKPRLGSSVGVIAPVVALQ